MAPAQHARRESRDSIDGVSAKRLRLAGPVLGKGWSATPVRPNRDAPHDGGTQTLKSVRTVAPSGSSWVVRGQARRVVGRLFLSDVVSLPNRRAVSDVLARRDAPSVDLPAPSIFSALSLSTDRMPKAASKTPTPASPPAGPTPVSYEAALDELEQLLQRLEASHTPLDQLLTSYQRGNELLQFCRQRLDALEQQVKVLDDGMLKPWSDAP